LLHTLKRGEAPKLKGGKMIKFVQGFLKAEEGLVTVEWVALAGALVIGAITVGWIVMNGLTTQGTNVDNTVTSCSNSAAANKGSTAGCTL